MWLMTVAGGDKALYAELARMAYSEIVMIDETAKTMERVAANAQPRPPR